MIDDLIETLKKFDEKAAAFSLLEALGRHSHDSEQYDTIARNLFKIKKYKEAVPYAEKCLGTAISNEQKYAARSNLVNVLAHAYQPERALDEIKILERLNPNDSDIRLKKAYALFLMGRRDEAEKILREELENPLTDEKTKNEINFNLGTYELYKDNFHEGLYRFLIHGRQMNLWEKPKLPFTEYNGKFNQGDFIVIRAEAGIGDEFINVRFYKKFKEMGLKPIWYTDRKEMRDIFLRMGYLSVSSIDAIKSLWKGQEIYWCHSMDVPVILRLKYEDLWDEPYLVPNELSSHIEKTDKISVGLRWQGNPDYDNDLHRSVPLKQLYDTVKDYDFDLYSLQRDVGVEEVYEFPDIKPLHEKSLDTFEQTLAEIRDLDLIITSCTSIAHAAAGMGKPTIVLSPMSSYYIWCHSGDQSPWYGDHVKLLRQKRPRYWDEPLAELKDYLNEILRDKFKKNT